jgi:uncharacterized membrane protein
MPFKVHLPHFSNKFYLIAFGLALVLAAYFRFWAATLSAGPDVPQFWAFAKVFQLHGLDFYRYADANLDIFPTQGWGFVYPPMWLLILRLALMATPMSSATAIMADSSWRLAMKTPIIAADLAIGCLLYWAVPGSKLRKLIFASLWLFHPTAWYNSAVFGQFDAIAAALLLASVIMLERGKDRIAFLLAGLAVLTKQHTLIPVAFMIAVSARKMGWRRLISNCAIMAGVVILFSIPFLITGNSYTYASSLILPGQAPGYQNPLMYAFSGSGALLTYLHNIFGWETSGFLNFNTPILLLALLAAFVLSYKRSISAVQGALIGSLIFISLFYRVNYQYLIIYIPLALLVASRTKYMSERIFTIVMALLPAAWLWLFDVSFWFNYVNPKNPWVTQILERIGLAHTGTPDYAFVSLALVLMCLFLAYIICAFIRWRQPPNNV